MHSVDEVLRIIGERVAVLTATEELATTRAGGRILGGQKGGGEGAGGVMMDSDSPPFDRALLDGFAVRAVDAAVGAELEIIGRQDASPAVFGGRVGAGQCVAINTGGVFPEGADAVLMVEHSERAGGGEEVNAECGMRNAEGGGKEGSAARRVKVLRTMAVGFGVQRRGSDARQGEEVVAVGARLGAAQIAAAVAAGAGSVWVRRRIRVAILTTGDELVGAGESIAGGQIRNSNHPMLLRLVGEALRENGEVLDLGTSADVEEELTGKLREALCGADLTLVSGGMSMGSRDHVPGILRKLGTEFHVEKVRMKPGKPFVFGTVKQAGGGGGERGYVAGLPGNPVSALVTFQLFVREILGRLQGEEAGGRWVRGIAAGDFAAGGEREFFHPCMLRRNEKRELVAEPLAWRGSGDIFTLARAQGLARRVVGAPILPVGGALDILLL